MNFQKISGEGLTEQPPQTPPRLILGFARGSGFALNSLALRTLGWGFALTSAPLATFTPPPPNNKVGLNKRTLQCPELY